MWPGRTDGWICRQTARGFSLLETLISAALFSLVITGVYGLYTTMHSTMIRGELKADLQQNARIGLGRMVREIRMAGYDPEDALSHVAIHPRGALRSAMVDCLSFIAYDSDRHANPAVEKSVQITYDLSQTTLRRKQENWNPTDKAFAAGAGAQPLAESVDLLTFTYYDVSNNILTPVTLSTNACPPAREHLPRAIAQLTSWELRQVRRIAITLRTRDARPGLAPEFYTLTADVCLRNQ